MECDAPMVSICGGEPLIYPKIEELVAGLRAQGRVIYICTNGMFMRKKMRDYLAAIYTPGVGAQAGAVAGGKVGFREGSRGHPQGRTTRRGQGGHPPLASGCTGTCMWTDWNTRTT